MGAVRGARRFAPAPSGPSKPESSAPSIGSYRGERAGKSLSRPNISLNSARKTRRGPPNRRALKARKPWVSAPSETMAFPKIPSVSSSGRSRSSRSAVNPKPKATAREAAANSPKARPSPRRLGKGSEPPEISAGRLSKRSPAMPPNPVESGQFNVDFTQAAKPAAKITLRNQAISRILIHTSGRWVKRRQTQTAIGNTKTTAARPANCIKKSAKTAPERPRRLRVGPSVARLKLGSSADQLASAALAAAAIRISARPISSASLRCSAPVSPSDKKELAREVELAIRPTRKTSAKGAGRARPSHALHGAAPRHLKTLASPLVGKP